MTQAAYRSIKERSIGRLLKRKGPPRHRAAGGVTIAR
jgi:hypothetical protein